MTRNRQLRVLLTPLLYSQRTSLSPRPPFPVSSRMVGVFFFFSVFISCGHHFCSPRSLVFSPTKVDAGLYPTGFPKSAFTFRPLVLSCPRFFFRLVIDSAFFFSRGYIVTTLFFFPPTAIAYKLRPLSPLILDSVPQSPERHFFLPVFFFFLLGPRGPDLSS